jgi:hypothetical protein
MNHQSPDCATASELLFATPAKRCVGAEAVGLLREAQKGEWSINSPRSRWRAVLSTARDAASCIDIELVVMRCLWEFVHRRW